ncbi:MAG: RIP metalloprotease RseP [Flavobacteriales bacterium]|nr:MAG: RIP metalloprotease RseP [Flavobacteriales bacterium]
MEILIKILQFILSLTILVTIHEFGHYISAKIFGARVDKFYIFFNPYFSLFKKKIGETEYGIGWLPLGGYCKIAGMVDESMDTESLKKEPQPWEYRSKPAWQRLIIIVGGVVMNILLAWFIYSMMTLSRGETYIASRDVKDGIMILDTTLANPIGLKTGDKIVSIDGKEYEKFFDTYNGILLGSQVTVNRNGKDTVLTIPVDYINTFKDNENPYFYYPRLPFTVVEIPDSSHNAQSGLRQGDVILSVSGTPTPYFDQASDIIKSFAGRDAMLQVERGDTAVFVGVKISPEGIIGVRALPEPYELIRNGIFPVTKKEYGFFEALGRGTQVTGEKISGYWAQVKKLVNPETGAYKSVGSVITMGNLFPPVWDWGAFWQLTAFLSIMLAVINILPIPALDGGHAVFIIYEMITRRQPSEKVLEYAQMAGFIILVLIMLLAFGNDILRLFS